MPTALIWTSQEDNLLQSLVDQHGSRKWSLIASKMRTKTSKQCRRRWKNFLTINAKTCSWSGEEDVRLMEAHARLGNRWTEISKIFGDRTDNAVKNRWHALVRKHPDLERPPGAHPGGGGGASSGQHSPYANGELAAQAHAYGGALHQHSPLGMAGAPSDLGSPALRGVQGTKRSLESSPLDGPRGPTVMGRLALQDPGARERAAIRRLTVLAGASNPSGSPHGGSGAFGPSNSLPTPFDQSAPSPLPSRPSPGGPWFAPQRGPGPAAPQHPPPGAPLSIRVSRDFLTPWELELADQVNALEAPIHIDVQNRPLSPPGESQAMEQGQVPADATWPQHEEPASLSSAHGLSASHGLSGILSWFASPQNASQSEGGPRAASRRDLAGLALESGAGSGPPPPGISALGEEHRAFLLRLMSRGLEARGSGDLSRILSTEVLDTLSGAQLAREREGGRPELEDRGRDQRRGRVEPSPNAGPRQSLGLGHVPRPPPPHEGEPLWRRSSGRGSKPIFGGGGGAHPEDPGVLLAPSFSSAEIAMLMDALLPHKVPQS